MSLRDHVSNSRLLEEIKDALNDQGCDICQGATRAQIVEQLKEKLSEEKLVVAATLTGGDGVTVSPVGRDGYKIGADSRIPLFNALGKFEAGTPVHNVLRSILDEVIPGAMKTASTYAVLGDPKTIRFDYNGQYTYTNPFNKSVHVIQGDANTYAILLPVKSQGTPLVVDLGPLLADFRRQLLEDVASLVGVKIKAPIKKEIELPESDHCPSEAEIVDFLNTLEP